MVRRRVNTRHAVGYGHREDVVYTRSRRHERSNVASPREQWKTVNNAFEHCRATVGRGDTSRRVCYHGSLLFGGHITVRLPMLSNEPIIGYQYVIVMVNAISRRYGLSHLVSALYGYSVGRRININCRHESDSAFR